jgi:hypothetical protein
MVDKPLVSVSPILKPARDRLLTLPALRPGLLNSLAGFITTLVGVYGARGGFWSVIAIITAAVTGTSTSLMLVLYLIYDFWRLNEVKKQHRLAIEAERARLNYEKDS